MITIRDVGPTRDTFPYNTGHSAVGRITALALGADGKERTLEASPACGDRKMADKTGGS